MSGSWRHFLGFLELEKNEQDGLILSGMCVCVVSRDVVQVSVVYSRSPSAGRNYAYEDNFPLLFLTDFVLCCLLILLTQADLPALGMRIKHK